jgi:hypothetical protein
LCVLGPAGASGRRRRRGVRNGWSKWAPSRRDEPSVAKLGLTKASAVAMPRCVQGRDGVKKAEPSATRPAAATSAGTHAEGSSRRTPASEAARSPPSVRAPSPAHIRTVRGDEPAPTVASSPPTPSVTSRTAKLRVIRVSARLWTFRPSSRRGAAANAHPMATLITARAATIRRWFASVTAAEPIRPGALSPVS